MKITIEPKPEMYPVFKMSKLGGIVLFTTHRTGFGFSHNGILYRDDWHELDYLPFVGKITIEI